MDTVNHFFTRSTVLHARLEYGLGFATCTILMLLNWSDLNVWRAIALFGYIDLFGTLPGMVAWWRSSDGVVSRVHYVMYNVVHSAVTQGLVVICYLACFGWEWAILAIPAHICADRSIFNNYPKPFGLAFEPTRHPAFQKFEEDYRRYQDNSIDWKSARKKNLTVDSA